MVEQKVLAEHSFYVSDDEKSIAVQDLLEDLKVSCASVSCVCQLPIHYVHFFMEIFLFP